MGRQRDESEGKKDLLSKRGIYLLFDNTISVWDYGEEGGEKERLQCGS
jgi:hypothetical protein